MDRAVRTWEIAGFLFVVIMGSRLHFVFAWSDNWPPLAIIAAVIESVREHLKLAFWPMSFWALIEWPILGRGRPGYWAAKALAFPIAPISITLIFYGYTAIIGDNVLLLDIATFVVAVALANIARQGS